MKAFLLAAGLGTRLRPLTHTIPKCLIPINGKPLLQIWLDLCQNHGINEIFINTHHLPHLVEDYFKINGYSLFFDRKIKLKNREDQLTNNLLTYEGKGLKIILSYEPSLLGSAGTILANQGFVEGEKEFFILYADNLTNVNLGDLLYFHRSHGDLFTMGLFKTERPKTCGIAELDGDGKIVSFEEKPRNPETNFAAAGVYVASPSIFELFPNKEGKNINEPLDLGFHILPKLTGHMYGYLINEYLLDIGDMKSYQKAQKEWPSISP